jgi:glutaconate CoA-transferase, subunit A
VIIELEEAVSRVRDGDRVGVGGAVLSRKPMAAVRALAAAGRRDLELVTFAGSLEVEELLAAGALAAARSSYVGLGPHGAAPRFVDAVAQGTIEDLEESEWMLLGGLRAASSGMPFLATRAGLGSDLVAARRLKSVADPYTGIEALAIPALKLDVAIVHAWRADEQGNIQAPWPPDHLADVDLLMARSAATVIVTVEELVSTEEVVSTARDTVLYPFEIDVVALAPGGAAPTAYPPMYSADSREIAELAKRNVAASAVSERK